MASDLIVPVVEVRNVREHPQADMLSIAEVLGYQMVSGLVEDSNGTLTRRFVRDQRDDKGRRVPATPETPAEQIETLRYSFRYKDGDRAVYFPADTILTDAWATKFEVKHLLKSGNRISRARLRGEPSFGLITEIPEGQTWSLGENVATYYDAIKYVPPPRNDPGDYAPYDGEIDPHFVGYTDIQNGKLLYESFLPNEEVVATEKIHGGNVRLGLVDGKLVAGSRTSRKEHPGEGAALKDFLYWSPYTNPGVERILRQSADNGAKVVILFGEVFGQGVQSLHYGVGGKKEKGFRAFDLYVDGRFLGYEEFKRICDQEGVETAPLLYRGPFDLKKMNEISNGKSTLPGADNIREGVVVRPVIERRDPKLGRVVLKFIGTDYELSSHKDKDTTDL
jgi:RNA ligase (TIGR02306 family)